MNKVSENEWFCRGIIPDHEVIPVINDVLAEEYTQLKFVSDLIKKQHSNAAPENQ